jgi:hypothetical protein
MTGTTRVLAFLVLGGLAWAISGSSEQATGASRHAGTALQAIPVLAPWSPPHVERDMPQVVQERNTRAQEALRDEALAAARLPATGANGCVPSEPGYPLGPPPPRVTARIVGHHVEILFAFARMPTSPACRPWLLNVVVYSGKTSSSTFKNWVERFRLRGARNRVAMIFPLYGKPPYHVLVQAQTLGGRMSRRVEQPLRCPGTGHATRGCLDGYAPPLHGSPMPKPVLPLRGLDRTTLQASLRQVLEDERTPPVTRAVPVASRCAALASCEVTYADPAFPQSRYRVRYRIAGQQVSGCWLGHRSGRPLGALPYEDAWSGRFRLAGCASWLR